MHQPKESDLWAINRILQYLKSTAGKGILYKKNKELSLETYTDNNWVGLVVD